MQSLVYIYNIEITQPNFPETEIKFHNVSVSVNESINSELNESRHKIIISKNTTPVKKVKKDASKEVKTNNFIEKKVTPPSKEKLRQYSADIRKTIKKEEKKEEKKIEEVTYIQVEEKRSKASYESVPEYENKSKQLNDSLARRKNFAVPVPKPTKPKEVKVPEPKPISEDEKAENMSKLIRNYEDILKSDVRKEVTNKSIKIQDKLKKKLQYVNADEILENICNDDEAEEQQDNVINEQEPIPERIIMNRGRHEKTENYNRSKSMPKKPKIDTFEIEKLIISEKKKFSETKNMSSFRKSSSINYKSTQQYMLNNDEEYSYAKKHPKRDREEIIYFINLKKQQEKEKAIRLQEELIETNLKKLSIL